MTVYPFAFDLTPKDIESGDHWLTLQISNIGSSTLSRLEVKLYSFDVGNIYVYETGQYINELKANEEAFRDFRVLANATAELYASVAALKDNERFFVETPPVKITVGRQDAELESISALTEQYTSIGKAVKVEAKVKALKDTTDLSLEFKVEEPSGDSKTLEKIEIKRLSGGQEARFTTEVTPKETGFHIIHAYLYHHFKRIGNKSATVNVE